VAGQALVLSREADQPQPGSGYGYGYGDGSGYGYGYGYGDGYGSGYGYGDGDGYGSGDGYGDGSGYGDGDGYGSGDGYGYGSGDGDGSGSGYGHQLASALDPYRTHPRVLEATADGSNITLAWWRSGTDGYSANGGKHHGQPATPGLVQEVTGPLELCSPRALHASVSPGRWKGDRWWIVGLYHPIAQDGDKAGSLKRLIIEELT
jgi:hypothetical protein